jgi:FkbM family methyltransferase
VPQSQDGDDLRIWDLGANTGQDTAYYLSLGASVVSVEANPYLVDELRQKFSTTVASGQLQIIGEALMPHPVNGNVELHLFNNDHLSTIVKDWAHRSTALLGATRTSIVEVPTCTLIDLIKEFGIPTVIKLDIEGLDTELLESLASLAQEFPALRTSLRYLSWETAYQDTKGLLNLKRQMSSAKKLGFTQFAVSSQNRQHREARPNDRDTWPRGINWSFEHGASGPFGDQLEGRWTSAEGLIDTYGRLTAVRRGRIYGPSGVIDRYIPFGRLRRTLKSLLNRSIGGLDWFDIHARKSSAL